MQGMLYLVELSCIMPTRENVQQIRVARDIIQAESMVSAEQAQALRSMSKLDAQYLLVSLIERKVKNVYHVQSILQDNALASLIQEGRIKRYTFND